MIVGEVRSEECLDLLLALNAGLPGFAMIHANSARAALVKMCTLPLLARFVVPTVATCVDMVVHLGIDREGRRRVREIVAFSVGRKETSSRQEADFIERERRKVFHHARAHDPCPRTTFLRASLGILRGSDG
jgi:pilus assembly protein CpaF